MRLLDNLVSYWKLDEASGSALDAHNSNHLTDVNTVGSATGKIGTGRDFDKANEARLQISHNSSLTTGDIDCTFACWAKCKTTTTTMVIAGKAVGVDTASAYEWDLLVTSSNQVQLWISDGTSRAQINGSTLLTDGQWHFIVWWHDSVNNQVAVQIDNGMPSTRSYARGLWSHTSASFQFGGEQGGARPFDGVIDEAGFWKRVLTSDQRTALYNSGNGLTYEDFEGGEPKFPATGRFQRAGLTGTFRRAGLAGTFRRAGLAGTFRRAGLAGTFKRRD